LAAALRTGTGWPIGLLGGADDELTRINVAALIGLLGDAGFGVGCAMIGLGVGCAMIGSGFGCAMIGLGVGFAMVGIGVGWTFRSDFTRARSFAIAWPIALRERGGRLTLEPNRWGRAC